jgi:hypothetical protein
MLKPGWYWVKGYKTAPWVPAYWRGPYYEWTIRTRNFDFLYFGRVYEVGGRIKEPK